MLIYILSFFSGISIAFAIIALYVFSQSLEKKFYVYFSVFSIFSGLYFMFLAISVNTGVDLRWAAIFCAAVYYPSFAWFIYAFAQKKIDINLWIITIIFALAYLLFVLKFNQVGRFEIWLIASHIGLVSLMALLLKATKKIKDDKKNFIGDFTILTYLFIALGIEEIFATYVGYPISGRLFTNFLPLDVYPILFTILIGRRLSQDALANSKLKLQVAEAALKNEQLKFQELENSKLETALYYKNKDLIDFSIDITRKKEFSKQLYNKLLALKKEQNADSNEFKEVLSFVKSHVQMDKELELLQKNIDLVNKEFTNILKENFPTLTNNDLQIASLLRLNLSTKEIANIKNISTDSAKVMRYRLRKKLSLDTQTSISQFLANY